MESLSTQAHVLNQQLEHHLLGNHLFANAKAIVFAGVFFEGDMAEDWLATGLKILDKQIPEQILPDGGNFELSPMYHCIVLTDMLDLINLAQTYLHPDLIKRAGIWKSIASAMLYWMDQMLHPDGEIAFFNDAAFGVAPEAAEIRKYADKLNISAKEVSEDSSLRPFKLISMEESGYIRVQSDSAVAILDCAPIGPDYLPGHAHADTLSFELSLFEQRIFVNSGTSCYGISDERHRQRSTAAHNTVEVNNKSSSEVWSGFRVARRAYPSTPLIESLGVLKIRCSHDGYERLSPKVAHTREWAFQESSMSILDRLEGRFQIASAHFHLHPDVVVTKNQGVIFLNIKDGQRAQLSAVGGSVRIEDSSWHPEFGLSIKTQKIVIEFQTAELLTTIDWGGQQ